MKVIGNVRRVSRPWIPFDPRQFRSGVNAAAREMEKIAIELTSGTTSTAELRRRGHPHSRRRPQGVPRLPINRQTGGLQSAIRIVRRVRANGEELYLSVNHPHAVVLAKGGTLTMVPRGFMEEFAKRTQGILKHHIQRAFRRK
jgi:hypothetical protein